MLKPTTGTVRFEDEEQESGIFIRKEDAAVYAKAIAAVLRALERSPQVVSELASVDLRAIKNLAHVIRGEGLIAKLDLRSFTECLKR